MKNLAWRYRGSVSWHRRQARKINSMAASAAYHQRSKCVVALNAHQACAAAAWHGIYARIK